MKTYTPKLNTKESIESLFGEMKDRAYEFDKQIVYLQKEYELSEEKSISMMVDLTKSEETNPGHKFAVILAITLFESFFTQLLKDLIMKSRGTYKLAEDIVDILFSYKAYVDLFNKLTTDSFQKALRDIKIDEEYHNKLEVLRKKRNNFIHGNPWAISRVDSRNAFDFALSSVVIFKELNNKYCAKARV